jgi:Flp pilus assembly pilin Flp
MLLGALRGSKTEEKNLLALIEDRRGVTAVEVSLLMLLLVPMLIVVVDLFQMEAMKRRLHQVTRAMASNVVANYDYPTFDLAQQQLLGTFYADSTEYPQTRVEVEGCECRQDPQGNGCDASLQTLSIHNLGQVKTVWRGEQTIQVQLKVKRETALGC